MDARTKIKEIEAEDQMGVLRADIDALRTAVSDLTRHLGKAGANSAAAAADSVKAAANDVGHWVSDRGQAVGEAVKQQPLLACSVSLAAGAILGALIARR